LPRQFVVDLIDAHTDDRPLGVLGDQGVNVLELNLALGHAGPSR
jgi:K+-transporting ATPase ATPase C chain